MCVLPSTQIVDGVLPGSHCGIRVCVDVSFLEPARWVAWWYVCVRVCECWVSLFVFRERLTVHSQSRWMNCKREDCGAAILLANFRRNPQHRTVIKLDYEDLTHLSKIRDVNNV